tara:strand:+ start:53 stop:244 length:192 start_codon:yes stop_codon:yes gene_type:complete
MKFDMHTWRSFSMWIREDKNKEEIDEFQTHLKTLYPEIDNDPDWLIKKYQDKYGWLKNYQPKK